MQILAGLFEHASVELRHVREVTAERCAVEVLTNSLEKQYQHESGRMTQFMDDCKVKLSGGFFETATHGEPSAAAKVRRS